MTSPILEASVARKSLGEKLCDAIYQPLMYTSRAPWNTLGLDSRGSYEVAALAFAASLTHDETASADHATQAARIAHLEERDALLQQAVLDRCAERKAARARAAELERALGRLGNMEAFEGPRSIDPVRDAEMLARVEYARAVLSASPPAAPSLPADLLAKVSALAEEAREEIDAHNEWLIEHPDEPDPDIDWISAHPNFFIKLEAALAPFADRVAGEDEPQTAASEIGGLCDNCSTWFGGLRKNVEGEWLCGPCRTTKEDWSVAPPPEQA